jgi:NADP-dependent 3-hydroxy acid dehydrogenase YdfG
LRPRWRGCNLVLADSDDAALAATAQELAAAHKVCVSRHHLDVSDRAAVVVFPGLVSAEHPGSVDILVSNAGVALGDTFEQPAEPTSIGCSASNSGARCG